MLVAAALCPHPPLLVSSGDGPTNPAAAEDLEPVRVACDTAVAVLLAAEADLLVVVGSAPTLGPFPQGAWGSLRAYGITTPGGTGAGQPTLPLSLTVASWLLDRVRSGVPALLFGVPDDAGTDRCLALGEALAGRAERVGLLVMGDGSARRDVKGPGGLHPRAAAFDEAVLAALANGDPARLAELDASLGTELLAAGRASWQVLAGAGRGRQWLGDLTWSGAPYGVTYLVATLVPGRAD